MINRAELKNAAKESLAGNWGVAIPVFIVYTLVFSLLTSATFGIGAFIFLGVMQFGIVNVFLGISRFRQSKIENLFIGFSSYFTSSCVAGLIMTFCTFAWTLLFYIPGIVKLLSYSMTFHVLNDHPEMTGNEAVKESMRIMNGHKMDLLIFNLSFIGWHILTGLTLGLASLYVVPYMHVATAKFYDAIKD
jgi:Predicted integral membrane protein